MNRGLLVFLTGLVVQSQGAWCLDFFFFNDTATTEIYTLSLHDALPILIRERKEANTTHPHPIIIHPCTNTHPLMFFDRDKIGRAHV